MMQFDEDEPTPFQARDHLEKSRSFLGKRKHNKNEAVSPQQQAQDSYNAVEETDSTMHPEIEAKWGEVDIDSPMFPPGTGIPSGYHDVDANAAAWMDGATERNTRGRSAVAAIFIHAGAGYHSTANENLHLNACSE